MPFLVPPIVYDTPTSYPPGTERRQVHPVDRTTNRWAAHFNRTVARARGRSILKENGVYVTVDTPDANRIKAAEAYYAGGHVHEVDSATGSALTAAGFTVYASAPGGTVHGEPLIVAPASVYAGVGGYEGGYHVGYGVL